MLTDKQSCRKKSTQPNTYRAPSHWGPFLTDGLTIIAGADFDQSMDGKPPEQPPTANALVMCGVGWTPLHWEREDGLRCRALPANGAGGLHRLAHRPALQHRPR